MFTHTYRDKTLNKYADQLSEPVYNALDELGADIKHTFDVFADVLIKNQDLDHELAKACNLFNDTYREKTLDKYENKLSDPVYNALYDIGTDIKNTFEAFAAAIVKNSKN